MRRDEIRNKTEDPMVPCRQLVIQPEQPEVWLHGT